MFELKIAEVESDDAVHEVVGLLRDYFLWLRRRYVAEANVLDERYDPSERAAELADLRGRYLKTGGVILVAHVDGAAAGCVMFRPLGDGACEMRRMFVRPAFHRMGIARALVCKLATIAAARGFRSIRLETGPRQYEAQALYRGIGFKRIAPYMQVSGWFADNMLFMEADTRAVICEASRPKHEPLPQAA